MKVLITGAHGKLGKELLNLTRDALHPCSADLDVSIRDNVFTYIKNEQPDVIVHCAALTSVRECEINRAKAWAVNVDGTENLVEALKQYCPECYFVYVSTACVFRGDRGDYTEIDLPYPKNFYGLTKVVSEQIVKSSQIKKSLIIRTNFVGRESWPYEAAFIDRYGTYLFADDLALAIVNLISAGFTGLLHVCGAEKLSMFELAQLVTPNVKPMTITDYVGPPLTVDMSLKSIRINPVKMKKP